MNRLTKFAQEYTPLPLRKETLDPWDIRYYLRAYKEHVCNVDLEKVKEYFPLDKVRDGAFQVFELLFGIRITEILTDNKWHDSVELHKVSDICGDTLGYFYLDLFPREGKYGHFCAFSVQYGYDPSKIDPQNYVNLPRGMSCAPPRKYRKPTIMGMACNFPEDGCISFDDVTTYFHEFGHLLHNICSVTQLPDFCGFGVERDFIEVPSTCMEYWCYSKKVLELISQHKDTNKPLPDSMIASLKKMKQVMAGYYNKRQIMFGMFDLRAHSMDIHDGIDSKKLWYDTHKGVMGTELTCDVEPVASFEHFMGGYDAGYYSYLRSETYAANIYYAVFAGDELNPKKGMMYRKKILEPGATKFGLDLLRDFLGCEPDDRYYLKDQGL